MTNTLRSLTTFALCALFIAGCPTPSGHGAQTIDGPEAHQLVAAGATLVDVRTSGEFESGHAEGAINIPVDDLSSRVSEIPREKVVVVYCASGMRSARAAAALSRAGYRVRDLGTFEAWRR